MAADRPEGSNLEQSIAKRMGNRLRRMFGLENLHDGSREDYEEAHEAIPEGGRPLQAETMPGRAGTASSLPDAGLSRPWSSDFEPFPTPGSGGGQSQGISGGGESGSAGTGLEAAGLAGGAAHTAPSGGSGPGHASPSGGGTGGGGGNSGAHTGPNGGPMSPLSSSSTGFKGETHRPITDKDEQVTGDEDKPVRGTVIENPISSEGKLLVLKSFTIEGFPTTHTPGKQPVSIPGIGTFVVDPLGNYSFTPAPNWNGQVPTIHYTVTDGYSTDNSALKINIKPIDDSFTDQSEKFVYDEDSGQHFGNLLKGSSSPDGSLSIKSFSVDGQQGTLGQPLDIPGKGTLTIQQDGTFEFQAAPNYNGPIPQATYTVTDGSGQDVQSTLNIFIKAVDDSFTDQSEKFVYDEDSGQHFGNLLKGSSSPDGSLSIKSFSVDGQQGTLGQPLDIPGKGTLTIQQDGTFEFQAAPNYNGPIPQASYTITDGSGQDVQSALNIFIKPVNDAPVLSAAGSIDQSEDQLEAGIHITAAQSNLLTKASDIDNQNSSLSIASINGQTANVGQPVTVTLHYTDADGHQQTQDVNLTVNADGSYSISQFDLDALPDGAKATATFSYTVKDPGGLTSQTQTANINITGTNDAPVLSAAGSIDQSEDQLEAGIHITAAQSNLLTKASDIDNQNSSLSIASINGQTANVGQPVTVTLHYTDADGHQQTQDVNLTVNADGSYSISQFDLDALPDGAKATATFSYTVKDPGGLTSQTQTANINITGTNDAPVLSAAGSIDQSEDQLEAGIHITAAQSNLLTKASDIDNQNSSLSIASINGQTANVGQPVTVTLHYTDADGHQQTQDVNLTVNADGSYSISQFDLDALPDGAKATATFSYTVKDPGGLTSQTQTANINITGTNDAPVLSAAGSIDQSEDQLEAGIHITAAQSNLLTKASDIDNQNSSLSIASINGQTANVGQPVTVTLHYTDADGHQQTQDVNLTVNADGSYSISQFDLDALPDGAKATATFSYTVKDPGGLTSQTQTANINITGTNDAPVLSAAGSIDQSEDQLEAGIHITAAQSNLLTKASDIDNQNSSLSIASINGQTANVGQPVTVTLHYTDADGHQQTQDVNLTVNADGSYSISQFDLDALPDGAKATATFSYTVKDPGGLTSQTQTANINITGTNDAPVLSAAGSIDQSEDQLEAGIHITAAQSNLLTKASDIDNQNSSLSIASINGQTANVGQPVTVTLHYTDADGHQQTQDVNLTVNADGSYSISQFDLDALPDGAKATATFSYTVKDPGGLTSQTQTANINITGTNDAPVLSAAGSIDQSEDQLEAGIHITAAQSNLLTKASDIDNQNSSLSIASINGQTANVGQPVTVTLHYTDADGHQQTQDVNLTVNADGSYSISQFDLDALPDGAKATATFSYTVKDPGGLTSQTQTANINITGTNDAPVLSAAGSIDQSEDQLEAGIHITAAQSNLLTKASDIDNQNSSLSIASINGQTANVGQPVTVTLHYTDADGHQQTQDVNLTVNADGSYSISQFDLDALPDGAKATATFSYTVKDPGGLTSQTQTANINITGTNDAPVLSAAGSIDQSEDQLEAGIHITAAQSNLLTKASDIDNQNSSLSIASINGQTANVGQPVTVTLHYTDADGHQQTQDVNLTVNADGSYSISQFDLDALPDGAKATATFSYTVKDPGGLTSQTQTANINITGTNDAPVLSAAGSIDQSEDQLEAGIHITAAQSNLLTKASDIDNQNSSLSIASINGQTANVGQPVTVTLHYTDADGHQQTQDVNLTVNADGSYSISQFDLDALPDGAKATATFSYTVKDPGGLTSQTQTANINITGTNDAPDAKDDINAFTIDQNKTSSPLKLLSNDTDVDSNSLTITSINNTPINQGTSQSITVAHGTVVIDANGAITFTPNKNYNGHVSFTYTVSDGHGGTDTATVQGTVKPAPPTYTRPPAPTHSGGEEHLTGTGIPTNGGTVGSHHFGGNSSPGHWTIVPINKEGVTGSATAAGMFGTAHIDPTGKVGYDLNSQSRLQQLLPPPNGKRVGTQLTASQLGGINWLHKLGHPKTSITLQTNSFTDVFAIYKDGNFVGFWVASWDQNIQVYRHDMGHPPHYTGGITDFKSWDLDPSAYPDYQPAPPPHGSTRMGQVHQRDAETSDFSDELNTQIAALEAAGIHLTEKAEVKEFLGTTILIVHTDHGDIVQAITNYADASPLRTIDPSGLDEEAQKALSDAGHPSTNSEDATNNNPGITQEPLPADDATRELLDGLQNLGLLDSSNSTETSQRTQEDGYVITTLTTHTNHGDIVQTITAAGNGEQPILRVDASELDPETQKSLQDSLKSSQEPGTSQNKLPNGEEGAEESKPELLTIDGAALTSAIQEIQKLDPAALAAMHSGHNPDETNEQINASTPTPLDANEVPVSSSNDVFSDETISKRSNPAETAPPEDDQDLTTGGELSSDTQQDESLFNL